MAGMAMAEEGDMAMAEDMATEDMARGLPRPMLTLLLMLMLILTTEAMAMEDMVDTVAMEDMEAMEVIEATMVDSMARDLPMPVLMLMLIIEAMAMAGTTVVVTGTVDMAMVDLAMVVAFMANCPFCCKSFGLTIFLWK